LRKSGKPSPGEGHLSPRGVGRIPRRCQALRTTADWTGRALRQCGRNGGWPCRCRAGVLARIEDDIRRCLTKVFPYAVLYSIEPYCVLVLAVMHCRGEPAYGATGPDRSPPKESPGLAAVQTSMWPGPASARAAGNLAFTEYGFSSAPLVRAVRANIPGQLPSFRIAGEQPSDRLFRSQISRTGVEVPASIEMLTVIGTARTWA
jgi:hypothetical protein